MKRYQRHISSILAGLALTFAGCSDDFDPGHPQDITDGQGVVVYVPFVSHEAATRAAQISQTRAPGEIWNFDENESNINDLYFFAFSDVEGADPVREKLTGGTPGSGELSEYTGYKVSIPTGEYRMYVVANYDDLKSSYSTITEDDLKLLKIKDVFELTSSNGLPMSCSTLQVKNSQGNYETPAKIAVAGGSSQTIKADLKFAVAKVRVTLLNDLDPSRTVGADPKITNVYSESLLLSGLGNSSGDMTNISLTGAYYDFPDFSDADGNTTTLETVNVDNLSNKKDDAPAKTPWAWQSIVYVGEYLFDTTASNKPAINIPLADNSTATTTLSNDGLKRSTFYDAVGNTKGKFAVTVQSWDPVTMAYSLHGAYFLHIDKTKISVKSGTDTEIWYETNGQLDFSDNPSFTNADGSVEPIYIFEEDKTAQTIRVSLSPLLSKADVDQIKSGDDWKVITLKSGTLTKKIQVEDIEFTEFLEVAEKMVSIDITERIGSGMYYGDIIIPITTNISSFTITKDSEWQSLIEEEYSAKSLVLQDGDGMDFSGTGENAPTSVTQIDDYHYSVNMSESTTGIFNLRVRYTGLNDGRDYWNNNHTLTIKVTGRVNDEEVTETITVYVIAKVDKYKIHVKSDYEHTHIYVYQALSFPTDMSPYTTDPQVMSRAGKPVGAKNNDDDATVAALQYSFTGALSFLGWSNGGDNDPTLPVTLDNGFRYFTNTAKEWEANNANPKHYSKFDFCADYRSTITSDRCKKCADGEIITGWPGIVMAKDPTMGDGWYYFELSGVATPGKALIIFTADHEGNNMWQYPSGAGIALFDYPSREAWIDVTDSGDNNFHSDKADVGGGNDPIPPTPTTQYTYRIYWPYDNDNFVGLNIWGNSRVFGNTKYPNDQYGNFATVNTTNGNYKRDSDGAYLEIVSSSKLSGEYNYQKIKKADGNDDHYDQGSFNIANFENLGNDIYRYTISDGGNSPRKIGLYWYKNDINFNSVCFYRQSDWSAFWPATSWTRQTATEHGQYYLVVLETTEDINAFTRLTTENTCGYSMDSAAQHQWSEGRHEKVSNIPSEFSSYGLTEAYRIW